MAEDDLLTNAGSQIKEAVSSGADFLIIILGAIIVIGLIIGAWLLLKEVGRYKHRVVIRYVTSSGRKRMLFDKAKEIVKNEVPYWCLLKKKDNVTVPPPEATEILENGNLFAECYHTNTGGYQWIMDTLDPKESFKEFRTQQRALYAQRIENAILRKKKSIWEIIKELIYPVLIMIIIVLILVFWKDIAEPVSKISAENARIVEGVADITAQQARITQVLIGNASVDTLKINQRFDGVNVVGGAG